MSESPMLLMTKIALPVTRSALIDRPRLHDHLQQALYCPLTLVCAPPGAGKTAYCLHVVTFSLESCLMDVIYDKTDGRGVCPAEIHQAMGTN